MDPVRAISLSALCFLLLGGVLYFSTGEVYSGLFILPAVAAAAAYSLGPQLRWWYWQRNAPDLDTALAPLLERFGPYRRLNLAGKREFRRRTFLYREATHFRGMAPIEDKIPDDVKVMVAASAAAITFHREQFLLKDVETVVFYLHSFPSPEHDRLHIVEFYGPDGAIIYKLNAMVRSVVEPDKYLQLGYYAYAQALLHVGPDLRQHLGAATLTPEEVRQLADFGEEALVNYIGLEEIDWEAITISLYHSHHERFASLFPRKFTQLNMAAPARYLLGEA